MVKRVNWRLAAFNFAVSACVLADNALALHGAGSVNLTTDNGWLAFELVTQTDNIAAISDPGYGSTATRGNYDGLGTYVDGNQLSINLNHETANAAISRVDLSISAARQAIQSKLDAGATPFPASIATGMGYSYDRIYDGAYHAVNNPNPAAIGIPAIVNYGNDWFDRFCSGTSYFPEAFGSGRGFVDAMYLTGEEVAGGKFYATDQATRTMWEVPSLGLGSWENAAQVDTGNTTHVALVLNSDVGSPFSDYIRLYVGQKGIDANADGAIDFLERNGLRGGTTYYFTPDVPPTNDLPDGTVTGKWTLSTAAALVEDKLEDVHTNPLDGAQLVFTDQTDGVYRLDTPLQFSGGAFDAAGTTVTISQIDDDDTPPLGAPDNLVWSRNGKIYVQEDGDGYEIWELDGGGGYLRIAQAFTEPSGIIDASEELGFEPGSVLLSSIMGTGTGTGAQLVALIAPTAQLAVPHGDFNRNGVVDAADYALWRQGLGVSFTPADYNIWQAHFGQTAGGAAAKSLESSLISVPEPAGIGWALGGAIAGLLYSLDARARNQSQHHGAGSGRTKPRRAVV
jgi:hypothetical protein